MIEVFFTLRGEELRKVAKFETVGELNTFLKNYEKEILTVWPEAINIRLGKYIQEEY